MPTYSSGGRFQAYSPTNVYQRDVSQEAIRLLVDQSFSPSIAWYKILLIKTQLRYYWIIGSIYFGILSLGVHVIDHQNDDPKKRWVRYSKMIPRFWACPNHDWNSSSPCYTHDPHPCNGLSQNRGLQGLQIWGYPQIIHFIHTITSIYCTIWLFNIAMENHHF